MNTGIELIAKERQEQIEKHGRTVEYDVKFNDNEELRSAAKNLLEISPSALGRPYGWDEEIWGRMIAKSYKERLIIAGALIAAELDRVLQIEQAQ